MAKSARASTVQIPVIAPRGQRKARADNPLADNPLMDMGPRVAPAASKDQALMVLKLAWFDEYTQKGTKESRNARLYAANRACLEAGCDADEIGRQADLAHSAALDRTKAEPFRENPIGPQVENPLPCSCQTHVANPLAKGCSAEVRGENIREMMRTGHPQAQAVAAAFNEQRKEGCAVPPRRENPIGGWKEYERPAGLTAAGNKAYDLILAFLKERGLPTGGNNDPKPFYSPREWQERGEEYGQGSELIVVYDGGSIRHLFEAGAARDDNYKDYEALRALLRTNRLVVEEQTSWYSAIYAVKGS